MSVTTLAALTAEFARQPEKMVKQGRGAMASRLDAAAAASRRAAASRYATNEARSADTIVARMAIDTDQVQGFLLANHVVRFQEQGTARHPARPVTIGPVDDAAGSIAAELANIAANL